MNRKGSVETMDEITNPNDILLPHDGTGLTPVGISVGPEAYPINDVLHTSHLKSTADVEDPLIEDIVNPSLDPEGSSSEPSNEVVTPLMHPSFNIDHNMHRPSPVTGVYGLANTPGNQDYKSTTTESSRRESFLNNAHQNDADNQQNQHTQPGNRGQKYYNGYSQTHHQPVVSLNKRKLLAKPHGVDKPHSKKKMSTTRARPAFVNKLWSMVNDSTNEKFIHWSDSGESIVVPNRERFVQEVLPRYFKHSNFASFVRQLNMYGWHKVQDVKSGSMLSNNDSRWEFENENFKKGKENLLENIVRQKPNSNMVGGGNDEVDINILMNELETVKYNQLAIAEDLQRITKDNEMLWKENMMARERHQSQQQVLEKILRFLSSVFGPNSAKTIGNGFQPDLIHELGDMQVQSPNNNTANMNPGSYHNEEDPMANVFGPLTPSDQMKIPQNQDHKVRPRLLIKNRSGSSSSSSIPSERASSYHRMVGTPVAVDQLQQQHTQQQQQQQQQPHIQQRKQRQAQPQFPYVIQNSNGNLNGNGSVNPAINNIGGGNGTQVGVQTFQPQQSIHSSNGDIQELTSSIISSDSPDPSFFQDLQNNIDRQEESIQEIQDWITKLSPGEDGNTPIFPDLNMTSQFTTSHGNQGQIPSQTPDFNNSHIEELQHPRLNEPDIPSEEFNPQRKRRKAT